MPYSGNRCTPSREENGEETERVREEREEMWDDIGGEE